MASATVTSKGQITIPVEVRNRLGLRPGSRVTFVPTSTGVFEMRVQAASVRDFKGVLAQPRRPVTLEEMDEAVAAGAVESLL